MYTHSRSNSAAAAAAAAAAASAAQQTSGAALGGSWGAAEAGNGLKPTPQEKFLKSDLSRDAPLRKNHLSPLPSPANEKASAMCGDNEDDEAALGEFGWPDGMFMQPVDELLRCPICALVMRDAVQCSQQHCFCKACLSRALESRNSCPICREPLRPSEVESNRMVRALVDRLLVKCVHHERGCTAALPLSEWEGHNNRCDFRLVRCENAGCMALVPKHGLNAHMAACEYATVECPNCAAEYPLHRRDSHSCVLYLRQLVRDLNKRLTAKDAEVICIRNAQSQLESRLATLEQQNATILARISSNSSPFGGGGGGGGILLGSTLNSNNSLNMGSGVGVGVGVVGGGNGGAVGGVVGAGANNAGVGYLRPALNDIVVLSDMHHMYGDAADGPLMMGVAGWVIADDETDDLPIRVHVHSRGEWWYAVGALRVVARAGDRVTRETAIKGVPVVRGADWKWENQDGGEGNLGFILRSKGEWCDVTWLAGDVDNAYRVGPRKFDLMVACMNGATT